MHGEIQDQTLQKGNSNLWEVGWDIHLEYKEDQWDKLEIDSPNVMVVDSYRKVEDMDNIVVEEEEVNVVD